MGNEQPVYNKNDVYSFYKYLNSIMFYRILKWTDCIKLHYVTHKSRQFKYWQETYKALQMINYLNISMRMILIGLNINDTQPLACAALQYCKESAHESQHSSCHVAADEWDNRRWC